MYSTSSFTFFPPPPPAPPSFFFPGGRSWPECERVRRVRRSHWAAEDDDAEADEVDDTRLSTTLLVKPLPSLRITSFTMWRPEWSEGGGGGGGGGGDLGESSDWKPGGFFSLAGDGPLDGKDSLRGEEASFSGDGEASSLSGEE